LTDKNCFSIHTASFFFIFLVNLQIDHVTAQTISFSIKPSNHPTGVQCKMRRNYKKRITDIHLYICFQEHRYVIVTQGSAVESYGKENKSLGVLVFLVPHFLWIAIYRHSTNSQLIIPVPISQPCTVSPHRQWSVSLNSLSLAKRERIRKSKIRKRIANDFLKHFCSLLIFIKFKRENVLYIYRDVPRYAPRGYQLQKIYI
jgi:hypothetical protein